MPLQRSCKRFGSTAACLVAHSSIPWENHSSSCSSSNLRLHHCNVLPPKKNPTPLVDCFWVSTSWPAALCTWEILLAICGGLIPSCARSPEFRSGAAPSLRALCAWPCWLLAAGPSPPCPHSTEHLTAPPCPRSPGASCATQSHRTQPNPETLQSQAPLIPFDPDTDGLRQRLSPGTKSDTACREPGHSVPSVLQIFQSSCTSQPILSGSKQFLLETARVSSISHRGSDPKPPPTAPSSSPSPGWFCSPYAERT